MEPFEFEFVAVAVVIVVIIIVIWSAVRRLSVSLKLSVHLDTSIGTVTSETLITTPATVSTSEVDERRRRDRERRRAARAAEAPEDRAQRRYEDAVRTAMRRSQESAEEREERLRAVSVQTATRRSQESAEEREERLRADAVQTATRRSQESAEEREERRRADRSRRPARRRTTTVRSRCVVPRALIPADDVQHHSCGAYAQICAWCGALFFVDEPNSQGEYTLCCSSGKVRLPCLPPLPAELMDLFVRSRHFLDNIRAYNAQCNFAANVFTNATAMRRDRLDPVAALRIQGEMKFLLGPLEPGTGVEPRGAQVHLLDEHASRVRSGGNLRGDVVQLLTDVMSRNAIAQQLVTIKEYTSTLSSTAIADAKVYFTRTPVGTSIHNGRLNAPVVPEIGVVLSSEDPPDRSVVVRYRAQEDQGLRIVDHFNHLRDPLYYAVFFPSGDLAVRGWSIDMKNANGKSMSVKDFYSYRLHERQTEGNRSFSALHYGRRLFHEYIIDAFLKMESVRLSYLRNNQAQLRADSYRGVVDAVNAGDGANVGRRIILPSTHAGSPRNMHEAYQDAMAIIRKCGRPDLFLTMTSNPMWDEVQSALLPRQTAKDRPDLVYRVFQMKLKALLREIDGGIFGEPVANFWVIEYQKRGLPHVHMIVTLKTPINTADIDKYICAELPDPHTQTALYEKVSRYMLHGPCGSINPNCPCMVDGKCRHNFPRPLQETTVFDNDAFPRYRRRPGATFTNRDNVQMGNQWVVPYNPYLLMRYDCHINVEYAGSIKAVKYLFKYVTKGNDVGTVCISESQNQLRSGNGDDHTEDEIKTYVTGRYVSTAEAFHRLMGGSIHGRSPNVVRLAVHLENGTRVVLNENSGTSIEQQARNIANNPPAKTTLTQFFEHNRYCADNTHLLEEQGIRDSRDMLYFDMPTFYTWKAGPKTWITRVRTPKSEAVGRMYTVSPRDTECFHMRILLCHVTGPTSFEDLKTVDGTICATYKDACRMRGLIDDDTEWQVAMDELRQTGSALQLRKLFVVILNYCEPSNPAELLTTYLPDLADDFLFARKVSSGNHSLELNDADRQQAINAIFTDSSLTMAEWSTLGMPEICESEANAEAVSAAVAREMDYFSSDIKRQQQLALSHELCALMEQNNPEQKRIFDAIMGHVNGEGACVFVDAPAGSGKTMMSKALLARVRGGGNVALATASTGIAGCLLPGGTTAHSRFKLAINPLETYTIKVTRRVNDVTRKLLSEAKLIIWDEAPNMHKWHFEALEKGLRFIMDNDKKWGGKTVVLTGDFRQMLPVIRRATPHDVIQASLIHSVLWEDIIKFEMNRNMRVEMCPDNRSREIQREFAAFVLSIGDGKVGQDNAVGYNFIKLPPEICSQNPSLAAACAFVYGDMAAIAEHNDDDHATEEQRRRQIIDNAKTFFSGRAILTTKNETVDSINEAQVLTFNPREQPTYCLSSDTVGDEADVTTYSSEILNGILPSGMPPHRLMLKVGVPVMLLRNINQQDGHCNGTRYIVTKINYRTLTLEKMGVPVDETTSTLIVPRIIMTSDSGDYPFELRRRQFPVRVAFAMTVNKSQGQTLKRVGVYLPQPIFAHGALYVALSRVGSKDAIKFFIQQPKIKNIQHYHTKNIVYKL